MTTGSSLEPLAGLLDRGGCLGSSCRAALLALPHTIRALEPATYVVSQGDRFTDIVVLLSGYGYRSKSVHDVKRQIVSLHIPGEFLDCPSLSDDGLDYDALILTPAEVAIIPGNAFGDLIGTHPAIGHAMRIETLVQASILREWMLNIGQRDARGRMAHFLCEFVVRRDGADAASAGGFELPMTQEQIGDALGLTPVHINRTLKALQSDGLIKRQGRNVVIPRWEALCKIAGFSSDYLHLGSRWQRQRNAEPTAA